MSNILVGLMLVVGWGGLVSATFIWVAHGIYELIKTDQSFWEILIFNSGFWVLQVVVSFILVTLSAAILSNN